MKIRSIVETRRVIWNKEGKKWIESVEETLNWVDSETGKFDYEEGTY